MGHHGANPGHSTKSGMGGNRRSQVSTHWSTSLAIYGTAANKVSSFISMSVKAVAKAKFLF